MIQKLAGIFPLTSWGLLFLILCAVAFFYFGVARLDLIYLSAGIFWAAMLALLVLWVMFVSHRARKRFMATGSLPFVRMTAGYPASTGYRIPFPLWTPFITISLAWKEPAEVMVELERNGNVLAETDTAKRRCFLDGITRVIEIGDVFGFTRMRWEEHEQLSVQVLPDYGKPCQVNRLLSQFRGEDISHPEGAPEGDRIEIRQYGSGDSFKSIIWKIYAQNRKLYVRVPERAIAMSPRIAAYMVSGRGDEPSASLARVLLEQRMFGKEWLFGADGSPVAATEPEEALRALSRSGNMKKLDSGNLKSFLHYSRSKGVASCTLFLPPDISSWKDALRDAGDSGVKLNYIIVMECLSPELHGYGERIREFFSEPESTGATRGSELPSLLKSLPATTGSVVLVDRKTGKVFNKGMAFTLKA